ncbi:MAG: EutP/PduV family microcompartment system protein [Oscillospiraceae bacterium]|jgi:ethanolamine utilization protein EutP|nr:EutP/PduV family microcompartment system protein [Oscillospiraceae bacterium]
MKRVMLMGASGCGKTTLCQRLCGDEIAYRKTQAIEWMHTAIDTPGEYLENRAFYKALVVTATQADALLFLQDATDGRFCFSPGQAQMFGAMVWGVVTKCDAASREEINAARGLLELAGAQEIFEVSAKTGEGCAALLAALE